MKKYTPFISIILSSVFIICSCISSAQTIPAYVPASGLLAWYPFNNNADNAYAATDNGVPYGGVSYGTDRFGSPLSCYVGNGSSGIDIPGNNFPSGNAPRSVAAWYKMPLPAATPYREIFATGDNSATGNRFGLSTLAGDTSIGMESAGFDVGATFPTLDSNWHHIVVTYPASGEGTDSIKIYLDGTIVTTYPVDGTFPILTTDTGTIHCIGTLFMPVYNGNWYYSWIGSLDDIGVWNRALTPCEVYDLYYATSACTDLETPPVQLTAPNQITIFPNPTATELTVSASDKITNITITNLIGQTMYTQQNNSPQVQIDVAALSSGIYFIKINGSEVRKFVKE